MSGKMTIVLTVLGLVILLGLLAGVALAQTSPVTVTLNPQNSSGESGTATLTDLGNGKTRVEVAISGEAAGATQPMHIHKGTCDNLDPAPAFPLTELVDGKSTTEVNTSLSDLMAAPYAINGHKSAAEVTVYVFCGNIAATSAVTGTTTMTATTTSAQATTTTTETTAATAAATESATAAATAAATTAATETATTAAAAAATETATTAATVAATTAAQGTATPTSTLPTTGASSPTDLLIPILILGGVLLLLGLFVRRAVR